jgi:phosphoesterase RecJ-like protein
MILDSGHDTCRINYRSKGKYIINGIAKSLGGGGHPLAAGAVLEGSMETVLPKVLNKTKQSLQEQKYQSK